MSNDNFRKLAERFCAWPLPSEVCVDSCATIKDHPHQRHGTNLLTVAQAEDMLRHVLADASVGEVALTGWASPTLGRAYIEIEQLRLLLAQPTESSISVALRVVLEAIEAADCELVGMSA